MNDKIFNLEISRLYSDGLTKVTIRKLDSENDYIFAYAETPDELEGIQVAIESIASQVREFRMKNFPEIENIE